ncbi:MULTISPECIES: hypothetical protein [unclassified Saccharicrinis]|uniref:hypothetical protein n=1 Tax=unclassified Saccharicrinis TaxID=2646859 RepID=UPI003D33B693
MNKFNAQNKKRTIVDYHKLPVDLKEQLKLVNSDGLHDDIITYKDSKGHQISALRLETDDVVYMVRMSKELAFQIMDEDDDFNDDYSLKSGKMKKYIDKHGDIDYISEDKNNSK